MTKQIQKSIFNAALTNLRTRYDDAMESVRHHAVLGEWDHVRMLHVELERLAVSLRDTENQLADAK